MGEQIIVELNHSKVTKGSNRWDYVGDEPSVVTSLYIRKPGMQGVKRIRVIVEEIREEQ